MIWTSTTSMNYNMEWIIDSGASKHITSNLNIIYDKEEIDEEMCMDNQTKDPFTIKGKVKLKIYDFTLILTDVYYVKSMKNLISMDKLMQKCLR